LIDCFTSAEDPAITTTTGTTPTQRDLNGRVAVITGGVRGIGLAAARMTLSRGARVALWDADGAGHAGDPVTGSKVDISNGAEITAAFGGAIAPHGKVDILVNSAGCWRLISPAASCVQNYGAGHGQPKLGQDRQYRLACRQGRNPGDVRL